ncbi:MAG TPA: hypothetical protein PKO15_14730 [Fibrobacteria bacterium]|nr:hypothetical protein [Fibrobacteria bacterium]HOX50131.1 hypothetical protein [Fibrobacteria bacterium]
MSECPSLPRCPFFQDKMANKPATANLMKSKYCQTDNSQCARWKVSQAKLPGGVPADLFPNEWERASQLVR